MIFQGSSSATVPNMGHHGTLHKARNADFMGTTVISRAAAEPVNTQETLNWRAFSVGGQPRPPQDGQQRAADCDSPARFFFRRKRFRLRTSTGRSSTPSDGASAWIAPNMPGPAPILEARKTAPPVTR